MATMDADATMAAATVMAWRVREKVMIEFPGER
jgi:hypothetical protein